MILVLNCGSQSLKFKIFDERLKLIKKREVKVESQSDYKKILAGELKKLGRYGQAITRIGHRIVHGGEKFREPIYLTPKILKSLRVYNALAPLHNPFNILGIEAATNIFPQAKQVGVFDTGFYKDLPEKSFTYCLPKKVRERFGFRRFGFHGISHQSAAETAAKKLGRPLKELNIITCHLGGGTSLTAVRKGKAIDTSMGFTPLEGLPMMTRSGSLDPGIVVKLCQSFSPKKAEEILNKESGLKGICGFADMREVLRKAKKNGLARLALAIYAYQIQKYIGAYLAALGSCDVLVFTGTIGEKSAKIRKIICRNLAVLAETKVLVIKTDEELAIARKIKQYGKIHSLV